MVNGMNERTLRGALIGCGFFGRIQHEAWQRIPGVSLVAACDPMIERAKSLASSSYSSAETMLESEDLDFIDIATRPDTHAALVRLAVNRGIPVICQKPLATTLEEAVGLVAYVAGRGVPVMVHENWRWQPWFRKAKALIDDGAIGIPLCYGFRVRQGDGQGTNAYPNQPYFREMSRLLVYETIVHFLDTARFFFGEISSVQARLRRLNPLIRGEDRALLLTSHQSEVDGVIDGHRFLNLFPAGPSMAETTIDGDRGALRILATGEIFRDAEILFEPETYCGYKGDSVRAVQQHFIDHLRTGCPLESSIAAYLGSFAAAEAAYKSAQEGREIFLQDLLSL